MGGDNRRSRAIRNLDTTTRRSRAGGNLAQNNPLILSLSKGHPANLSFPLSLSF